MHSEGEEIGRQDAPTLMLKAISLAENIFDPHHESFSCNVVIYGDGCQYQFEATPDYYGPTVKCADDHKRKMMEHLSLVACSPEVKGITSIVEAKGLSGCTDGILPDDFRPENFDDIKEAVHKMMEAGITPKEMMLVTYEDREGCYLALAEINNISEDERSLEEWKITKFTIEGANEKSPLPMLQGFFIRAKLLLENLGKAFPM